MTGGGLLALVAYGSQNVLLSGNPDMTFWYKTYRKYSHYSQENVTVALEGPNELFYTQPIKLRAKIQRIGDLLSDMYFTFTIPDIFSKYVDPGTRSIQYQYQWVRYLGAAIIQNAAFFVGGQKIQEVDGTYLLARALIDYPTAAFSKWRTLVGDTPELTNSSQGVYAGGTAQNGYPSVYPDPTHPLGAQVNRPSIFGQEIHVPLNFWFQQDSSLALPLVGLQYHDCEVQLNLNPIESLYTILDISGYRVNPNYKMLAPSTNITMNLPEFVSANDPNATWRNFATDVGSALPSLDTWFLNPRLQCSYVYLSDEERKVFATQPLSYCFSQVTPYNYPGMYTRQLLDLYTHNPVTRLLFIQRRSDSLPYRNDFANFTNWYTYPYAPFIPTPSILRSLQLGSTSGIFIPNTQQDIIRGIRILCDGNEIQESKPVDYFTNISTYRYTKGIGQEGLPLYSFQLGQSPIQASGSINASRIRNFQIDLDIYDLPASPTYTYDITVYVENINWFEVVSGMGGLKYAL